MGVAEVFAELDRLIGEAAPQDHPSLIVGLAARLAQLGAGLAGPLSSNGNGRPTEEPERWLSAEQAAEAAGLPMTKEERERSLKRLYSWAKGKPWASNPTGRFLRIHERRFRGSGFQAGEQQAMCALPIHGDCHHLQLRLRRLPSLVQVGQVERHRRVEGVL